MDYDQFRTEYDPVFDVADTESLTTLAVAVARLKQLAATIEDPADRRSADNDIADLEGVLAEGDGAEPISPAMLEAIGVYTRAGTSEGTAAERIARAEAGMDEIARIADNAPHDEQAAILEMNESLYMLVLSLEPGSR